MVKPTYAKMTEMFVETLPMGKIISSWRLIEYGRKKFNRKISPQKAARLLDGCMDCLPAEIPMKDRAPKLWRRIA